MTSSETVQAEFLEDVFAGLSRPGRRTLPCKYLYDATGSALFEKICELPEYYLTRSELSIMERHAGEMARLLGPRCLLIEYGTGSGVKTRYLLDRLVSPAGYVPIDISEAALNESAASLAAEYPKLPVMPVHADYLADHDIPVPPGRFSRRAVYFPGSTIGNLDREAATDFLLHIRRTAGPEGALLIGVDVKKDKATIEAAYNDSGGVTAAFNKNLLERMNRELGADFDLRNFEHRAVYDEDEGRIEMFLVSLTDQTVRIRGETCRFTEGERILTEISCKYGVDEFAEMAAEAGFSVRRVWTDEAARMSVQLAD